MDEPLNPSGEDEDFRKLLKEIKTGKQEKEALLENSIFKRRVRFIGRTLTENHADAEELINMVSFRACHKFDRFEPEFDKPYGNFFAWVRRIAQNLAFSDFRRKSPKYSGDRPEEMPDVQDEGINVASDVEVREALERFLKLVRALGPRDRAIMEIWVEGILKEAGYSLREIAEKLREAGISCSHVTIGKVVRDVTEGFIKGEEPTRRNDTPPTVSRKGEQTSGLREKDDAPSKGAIPFKRKTGS